MLSILLNYLPKMQYSYPEKQYFLLFQDGEGQTSFIQREMKCFVSLGCVV